MSTLYVNKIRPQAGTVVAVTGTLDVSGSVLAHKFESITHMDTTYEGSNKFGNDATDTHQFTGSIFVGGNSTLGDANSDVVTVTARLTASQGLTSTDAAFFNANVTLGNAAADIITSTGQLTASQGLTSTDAAFFNANVTLGNASSDVVTVTSQLTASQGATFSNHVTPSANNTYDLGSSTYKWANVYTGDLHLKNDRGDWTILEEEDYLCVVNNRTGKKYEMMLKEIED